MTVYKTYVPELNVLESGVGKGRLDEAHINECNIPEYDIRELPVIYQKVAQGGIHDQPFLHGEIVQYLQAMKIDSRTDIQLPFFELALLQDLGVYLTVIFDIRNIPMNANVISMSVIRISQHIFIVFDIPSISCIQTPESDP